MQARATEPVLLPPPSAELVLIRVFVSAYLATAHLKPARRARAFLDEASRILKDEESVAVFVPGRSSAMFGDVVTARRAAIAMFNELLPTFAGKLPPDDI